MINAEIIADSIGPNRVRITTFLLVYPRFIHSEMMTHRVFSRNSASSRAIPFKTQMRNILKDPATPLIWTKNQPGMQGGAELPSLALTYAKFLWKFCGLVAVCVAWLLAKAGLHKQYVNRIVEPWSHITVVVTSTFWTNFFCLRDHPDAQPEIRALARAMKIAMSKSTPKVLEEGEWHIPFGDTAVGPIDAKLRWSVACCARVSYLSHDKKRLTQKEQDALYSKLLSSRHFSPFEHQAAATSTYNHSGNFFGWRQYRHYVTNE